MTPKPTVWKTPKPTMTPKPTNPPKTPRPTNPPKTTYLQTTPKPTTGWGSGKPMTGCAKYMTKSSCSAKCVWKSGYPPYSFAEDSKYQLVEEEFAMNGGFDELVRNADFQMYFGIGLLIAAVLIFAFRQYTLRKEKALNESETTPLVKV